MIYGIVPFVSSADFNPCISTVELQPKMSLSFLFFSSSSFLINLSSVSSKSVERLKRLLILGVSQELITLAHSKHSICRWLSG